MHLLFLRDALMAVGLTVAAGLPSQAQTTTEPTFWAGLEADQPAQAHAYLRVFPQGPHAAELRARLAGPPAALAPAEAVTLAAALQRRLAVPEALAAQDAGSGEACQLTPRDILVVEELGGPEARPVLRVRVLTSHPGSCRAATLADLPFAAAQPMLEGFARGLQARRIRAEATPAELAAWQRQPGPADLQADVEYARSWPDSPLTELVLARLLGVMRAQAVPPPAPAAPNPAQGALEIAFWQSAERQDTEAAYQAYLARFPDGVFAPLAMAALQRLAPPPAVAPPEPTLSPEQAEAALQLGRDQWLAVQRALAGRGYPIGEADGFPGPRTRQAIQQFQRGMQWPDSGFLDAQQLAALQDRVGKTPEQTEATLQLGRDQWLAIQRALQALDYNVGEPDGFTGPRTRQAIQQFQRARQWPETGFLDAQQMAALQEQAADPMRRRAQLDQQAWAQVRDSTDAAAVQNYLRRFPNGAFAEAARARLEELRNGPGGKPAALGATTTGTLNYNDGARYVGALRDGKPNGRGVLTLANGERYEGDMVDGNRNGRGSTTWTNGDRYEGDYRNNVRHGRGTYTWADGGRFVGDYRDNERHGRGVNVWANGDRYDGDYRNGARTGRGLYIWANGNRYEGEWRDNRRNGRGVFTWANGQRSEGEWRDDQMVQ